jgi:hypothetical protein
MAKKLDFKKIGVKALGLGGGAIVASLGNKIAPNLNPMIRGAAKIAVGALLPTLMPRQEIIEHLGDGIMTMGAAELIGKVVPGLSGLGDMDESIGDGGYITDYQYDMGAVTDDSAMSGDDDNSTY